VLLKAVRDFNQRQVALFVDITTALRQYQPLDLQPLLDEDVIDAAGALAATFETAAAGVIYEHRPHSRPAARLVDIVNTRLTERRGTAGTAFDRDAAVVLRHIEGAARGVHADSPTSPRAFLDLLGRVLEAKGHSAEAGEPSGREPSRLIVS
jgi:hypothetical protein